LSFNVQVQVKRFLIQTICT